MSDARSLLGARPTGRTSLTTQRGGPHGRLHYARLGAAQTRCGQPIDHVAITYDRTETTCTTCYRNLQSDAGLRLLGWPTRRAVP